ncbi:hypothetical protein BV511_08195 [Methylorubrum extorquens]|uniref:Uncharacterized protein n=1 Tax=Methylorubrum extorquens TaxID=408 RepID=A0A1S1NWG4_METEX|nr:hypothetical protein BV511_08195 [Methylorubrum extorquens]OHV15053.1 hypothetical protein BK022_21850 [Methylorubrum extorquens]
MGLNRRRPPPRAQASAPLDGLPELKFWKSPLRAALFAPQSRHAASSSGPAWSLAFGLSRRAVPRYLVK